MRSGRMAQRVSIMNRSKTLAKVIKEMEHREALGILKYGTTVDRNDLTLVEWLEHAKEEAMDQVLYLQAAINNLKGLNGE